jgi:protochlorophyllide reductase
MAKWNKNDIPDLSSKTALVTGANSGLGFETSKELARKGCQVILASRNMKKATKALNQINKLIPKAKVQVMQLDLASLTSIKEFSAQFHLAFNRLDLLCNNAGVMALPYCKTEDDFEMQFGTNHLGHFALTGLLLDILLATENSRIVTTCSLIRTKIYFNDLNWEQSYSRWNAYGQSKLANLLFTYELQRRLTSIQSKTISVACHPGYTSTNLQFAGPKMSDSKLNQKFMSLANYLFAQKVEMGILPCLYALISSDVKGGNCIAPRGIFEWFGYPQKVNNRTKKDKVTAARLWAVSEELTGINYAFSDLNNQR